MKRRPYDSVGWQTSFGTTVSEPMVTGWSCTQWRTSKTSEKSSISPPSGEDAAPSRAHVFAGPYSRPGSWAGAG